MKNGKRYSIIDLAESLRPNGDIKAARYERGLGGMLMELLPQAHGRSGAALPTESFSRDLEIGAIDAGQALAATSVLPVAQAVRPRTIIEEAGASVVNLNDTSATNLPRFDGDSTDAFWVSEGAPAPTLSSLTVKSAHSTPKCCSSRIVFSRRLMASVSDKAAFEASLLSELRRTIRSEIERKLFSGTGSTNQPQGLYNVPGRGTQSFSAALPTFPELISMLKTLANANGNIDQAAFLINTSDWADLLTSTINTEGTATVIDFSGGKYRIGGVRVFLSTAATQGKVCLAQMDRVNLVNYGPPQLIVDAYSSGKSTFGSTELIVQNYLDLIVTDPAAIVVGGS